MFCPDCGKEVPAGSKFCPDCGKSFGDVPNAASGPAEQQADASSDADQNKLMAILAYIFFVIPVLTGDYKKSEFIKYHTNQGAVLIIFSVVFSIATYILRIIISRIGLWWLGYYLIRPLPGLAWLVLCILGIVNVTKDLMKPLPVIGNITIIK